MSVNIFGSPTSSALSENRASSNPLVGGGVSLGTLRSLYLSNTATKSQRDSSFVTFPVAQPQFPHVKKLNPLNKKRILVTGAKFLFMSRGLLQGAGFVGSHLVDRLMLMGHDVICVDNYFTGSKANIIHWVGHPNFEMIRHDVVDPLLVEVDQIYHLACPASPVHYQSDPVKTLKTSFFGTYNMLGLAKRVKARFLLASTSEIYGSPEEHPQNVEYWGHVNCVGPRACYDEGKRVAEALTYSYARQEGVDVRVARIFNTFGPRMNWNDGREVSNFIMQALRGEDITVYGNGSATRSFQYMHDLIDGLIILMNRDCTEPVNLGNPHELTIKEFAYMAIGLVNQQKDQPSTSEVVYLPVVIDDPPRRKPGISRAKERLGWEPRVSCPTLDRRWNFSEFMSIQTRCQNLYLNYVVIFA